MEDEHAIVSEKHGNDDELIVTARNGELRNEENVLVEIVNEDEIEIVIDEQAIEVNVIVEAGREDEASEIMKSVEIINIENGIEVANVKKVKMRKCLICDFEANTGYDIKKHKESVHNWCSVCFSNFKNQDILKKHNEDKHKVK